MVSNAFEKLIKISIEWYEELREVMTELMAVCTACIVE